MKNLTKKHCALVLKMTIAIGCGSALAGCGNAQNKNGQAAEVAALQAKIAAYQGRTNPATGQPASTSTSTGANALNNVIWASDCYSNANLGNGIGSYGEVYMFEGTAWFAEFGFWTSSNCSGDLATVMPTGWTNNFGAGYILNMPATIAQGSSGTLNLTAWDSTTAIGSSINLTSIAGGLSPTGGNISLTYNLQAGPNTPAPDVQSSGTTNMGSLMVSDIVSSGQTVQLQVYGSNTPY